MESGRHLQAQEAKERKLEFKSGKVRQDLAQHREQGGQQKRDNRGLGQKFIYSFVEQTENQSFNLIRDRQIIMVTIYIQQLVHSQIENPLWLGLEEWQDLYFLLDSASKSLLVNYGQLPFVTNRISLFDTIHTSPINVQGTCL